MDSMHEKLLEELDSLGNWYHRIDLGEGNFTTQNQKAPNPEAKWDLFEPHIPSDFPKLHFIEKKYVNSPGNWWLPNDSAIIALLRNAQLKIIGRHSKEIFVCQPTKTFGKRIFDKRLVFPGYGKEEFDNLVGQKF